MANRVTNPRHRKITQPFSLETLIVRKFMKHCELMELDHNRVVESLMTEFNDQCDETLRNSK